jgi:hypothetical protein
MKSLVYVSMLCTHVLSVCVCFHITHVLSVSLAVESAVATWLHAYHITCSEWTSLAPVSVLGVSSISMDDMFHCDCSHCMRACSVVREAAPTVLSKGETGQQGADSHGTVKLPDTHVALCGAAVCGGVRSSPTPVLVQQVNGLSVLSLIWEFDAMCDSTCSDVGSSEDIVLVFWSQLTV